MKQLVSKHINLYFLGILGLMIFSTAFSLLVLANQSLRLDEAQSLWQSSRSPLTLLGIIAEDVHVPLYHLLLHFWQTYFGNTVYMGRIFSLIFFILTIPMLYLLGKQSHSKQVGLFAATIFAISPFVNWYGNEIRMYSLLTLLAVINQYYFLKLLKQDTGGYWFLYGLSALLGIYTHYFFWLVLTSQAVFFVARRHMFPAKALRNFIITALVLVVLFAPWVWYVQISGSSSNTQPLLETPTTNNIFNAVIQFIFGFQDNPVTTGISALWPLTILLGFLTLTKSRSSTQPLNIYYALSFLLPIVLAFGLSLLVRPLFLSRYLIIVVPSLYILISSLILSYSRPVSKVMQAGLIGALVLTLTYQTYNDATPVKEDYRQAATYLEQHAHPQDVIILSAPFTIYPVEYYYNGPAQLTTLPIWDRFSKGPIPSFSQDRLPQEVEKLKGSRQTAWLLLSYDQGYQEELRMYFDSNYHRLDHVKFSPGMELYSYQLRYDTQNVSSN